MNRARFKQYQSAMVVTAMAALCAQAPVFAAGEDCCAALARAHARELSFGESTIDFSDDTPTYTFATGESRYILLAIPNRPAGKALRVDITTTKTQGVPGFPRRTYFHPNLLVLDSTQKQIGEVSNDAIRLRTSGLLEAAMNYSGTFIISAKSQAKYVVFRTTAALLAGAGITQRQCYSGAGGLWTCFNANYTPSSKGTVSVTAILIDD